MSLFKKIISVFTGKREAEKPSQGNKPAQKNTRHQSRQGQERHRPAAANGNPTGGRPQDSRRQGGEKSARPQHTPNTNRRRDDDRPRRDENRSRPQKQAVAGSEKSSPRSQRSRGRHRPGGALPPEQIAANQAAHAAWSVESYAVAPEEGKVRFTDLDLPGELLHAVADLGFQYCTPIQEQSLASALAGKNVAGKAQTGTGKTAAFLIAILTRYLRSPEKRNHAPGTPRALVLAPTRELVIQICKDAETLGKYCGGIRSLAVYGGMDYERQREDLSDEPVDLLVATPGRLLDFVRQRVVDLSQVDTLVIDEADRMLDMGFIPDVRAIVRRLPEKEKRCTMLYSATLDDTVMRLASQWMEDPVRVEIESEGMTTDNIRQIVYITTAREKFTVLYNQIQKYADARTIIFCNRKSTTERVADNLRRLGIPCETLSGDVSQSKRLQVLEHFRAGKIRTVVATDVAGRGIHVDDIAFVINYDFPYEPEDYVHRIGRTGRAGATGTAISFADEDESFTIPEIEAYIGEPLKCTIPDESLLVELPAMAPRGQRGRHQPPPRRQPEQPPADKAHDAEKPAESSESVEVKPMESVTAAVEPPVQMPAEASETPAAVAEPEKKIELKPATGSFPQSTPPEAEVAPAPVEEKAPATAEAEVPRKPREHKPRPRATTSRTASPQRTAGQKKAPVKAPGRKPAAKVPSATRSRSATPRKPAEPARAVHPVAPAVKFQPGGAKNDVWTPGE